MRWRLVIMAFMTAALVPRVAAAQASISGLVRDTSGAVLPGVTVEASSPALIEKTRVAATDDAGLYSIVSLPPGTYTVTFTLPGFAALNRQGIVLTGAFGAEINAELQVGGIEQTLTVSAAPPVVDVRNTLQEQVLTKDELERLPGTRTLRGRAALVPGVVVPNTLTGVSAHGSDLEDANTRVDGYRSGGFLDSRGAGQLGIASANQTPQEAATQELVYDIGGQGAEFASSGVRLNLIPKEGGNRLVAEGVAYGSNRHFESSNLTPYLESIGLKYAPQLFTYDFNLTVGGPIKRDKLWYFVSFAAGEFNNQALDIYFKPNEPSTPVECRNRPPDNLCLANTGAAFNPSESVRITHQVSAKHKLRYSFDNAKYVYQRVFGVGEFKLSPEAAGYADLSPTYLGQVKYSAPITSRLLIEAGVAYERSGFITGFQPANPPTNIAKADLATGWIYENALISRTYEGHAWNTKASVAYVTGSHSLKAGFENRSGHGLSSQPYNGDMFLRLVYYDYPVSVGVTNAPARNRQDIRFDGGVYVQDQWRIRRLTINVGGRWDHFNAGIPANSAPASFWTPAVMVPAIPNVPNWNDVNGRLGGAWDVFGNGKTAVKASLGRYVGNHALDMTGLANPLALAVDFRSWTDLNGDGTVINADGTPQYAEVGPSFNNNFGTPVGTTRLDPGLRRDKNWSYELSAQHTLLPRVSISGSYFHRRFYDLIWTDNRATTFDSYIPITFTGPSDTRLPGGGGERITIYTIKPDLLGVVDNVAKNSSDNFRTSDFFEVTLKAPLTRNGFILTAWTVGKTHTNSCEVENPNDLRFCDTKLPFRHIYKLSGGVPLPLDMMLSGSFQVYDTPGQLLVLTPPYISAQYSVDSATAGYPLTGGGSIQVNLLPPGRLFNDYYKVLDVRLAKTFTTGRLKTTALAEFENLFNLTSVVKVTETYAPGSSNWLRPNNLQRGRNVRWGVQMRF